jgi:hypothetical protein
MKKVQICSYASIIVTLLVSLAFSTSASSASITFSTPPIPSMGSLRLVSAKNWALIPGDWRVGDTQKSPTSLDYTNLHNGDVSVKMGLWDGTHLRELDTKNEARADWNIPVNPGDHIIFKIWMKTTASSFGDTALQSGIRFGIDLYGNGGLRIIGIQTPDGTHWSPSSGDPSDYLQSLNYVHWNHDWEQRTMDFIVENQYPCDGQLGGTRGQYVTPTGIIGWTQVYSTAHGYTDNGIAWFADAELYINP